MAQTQQPDDEAGARANGATGGMPRIPEPGSEAATSALPPFGGAGGLHTPGRGVPMGTVGDGRYRLTHRLGRGGMAEVFAAEDIRLGRTVAVKLLRGELAQDEVARVRFTREAHAVAALNHHSIVAVYDTGEEYVGDESTPYIVMELVEGRTVRELLVDEEAPPVDQALIIIAGVLEALAYSHRNGIVHRDIKPANVIITHAGAVKVMDFGIARALTGGATTMTQTGMVMGTPQYLSPEQALGKAVDHRSDLYAAGCMLYELLTLRPPFTGDTPLSVVYQHVQDMPVPPSQANSRVPLGLDPLVLRSLAKNPDDRFQDADEFRAHLQHALREMHGAAGAGWVGTAAGMPGDTGATQVLRPDQAAATQAFGAVGPGDQTSVLPYSPGGPHTPAPYQGAQGGDDEYDDHDDHGRRRRGPWAWVAGGIAVLVAAGAGIAFALSGGGGGNLPVQPSTPAPAVSTVESTTPNQNGQPTQPPSTSGSRRPNQPADTGTYGSGGGTGGNNMSPSPGSGKHSTSPSPTPSHSASASTTPTGGASTAPTSGTGEGSGSTAPKPPQPSTKPPGGNGGAGGAGGAGAAGGSGGGPTLPATNP
ncbi:protein kinase [Kitasatospora sp. NPDC089509]|uniref:protein kinase domain-containing protein n=1 Tax=Kitasatospora sp. NPDC089509 TaxID=3364079 RepID=UPI003820D74C